MHYFHPEMEWVSLLLELIWNYDLHLSTKYGENDYLPVPRPQETLQFPLAVFNFPAPWAPAWAQLGGWGHTAQYPHPPSLYPVNHQIGRWVHPRVTDPPVTAEQVSPHPAQNSRCSQLTYSLTNSDNPCCFTAWLHEWFVTQITTW